mgnify:CR=1 FL=1
MVSTRGLRNVIDGEVDLLVGFEFNTRGKLGTSLYAPFIGTIDRPSGKVTVDMTSFIPSDMIVAPGGTTHFKIVSAGAEIDFEAETFVVASSESNILKWNGAPCGDINHLNQLTPDSTKPLFLVLGIEFYQEVNGQMYSLKNGAFNPLAVVKVDSGV